MSCIVVVGGLIGSGKSTLIDFFFKNDSELFEKNKKNLNQNVDGESKKKKIYKIVFDELCSLEEQEEMMKTLKGWRNFRSDLLMAAEYFVNAACGTECLMKGPLTQRSQNLLTKIERLNNSFIVVSDGIFFVEDNFYYRSMRYEWFQMARRMNIGFCEIFLQCPLNTAVHRNSIRGYSIPEQKIRMMVSTLEYPNPRQFKWEKYSLVFDSSSEFSCSKLIDMVKLIEEAAKNPAERLMNEEKLEAQKLLFLKENIFTAEDFESLVELTISIRQDILNGIRSRVIPLPEELLDNFHTFGVEKVQKEFEEILVEIFDNAWQEKRFLASGNDIGETLKSYLSK
ncbi:l-seryl-tRNA(Sec) kinase [Trichonephila inaurata madagascariensis]|uniref:L-seryl-tRNA(Sec) kinase n=1 Tax=Trichonephila inaurata madagascariensis TaxID=2747483 RepID=A0A8X6Y3Q7_9ARAC|nr:l-seryl-tRNA(Sec) kinase [Trichonephila inaurata madagascariensis]